MKPTDILSRSAASGLRPSEPEVLVIDDDRTLLEAMTEGLAALGMKAHGVSSSIEALMQLSDLEPTCIVVDLKMPGVDGFDLLTAICSSKRHVVVVLSAYIDVPTAVEVMRIGALDVVQKPATVERVHAAIVEALKSLAPRQLADDLTFTRRERQVAELIVHGFTAKQIAQKLSLSHRTIEFFRTNLMRKTHSANSAALASALTRIGFS